MARTPEALRQIIGANIRACRAARFPGRGGGKKCAAEFGVSQQQWSPWETGNRTPDKSRLAQLAEFFGVTVDYLCQDHSDPDAPPEPGHYSRTGAFADRRLPRGVNLREFAGGSFAQAFPACPFYRPPAQGQGQNNGENLQHMCWLSERFFSDSREFGITFRLHPDDINHVLKYCMTHKLSKDA